MNLHMCKRFGVYLMMLLFVGLTLVACDSDAYVGKKPAADDPVLTVSEALEPATLGRTIRVKGRVAAVCQMEGCWMTITDGERHLRMSFNDDFYVPLELDGEVIVEGKINEEVHTEESAKEIGETIGLSPEEIEYISGDQRIPIMSSTGVLFLGKTSSDS